MENQDIKQIPDSCESSNLTELLNNSSDTVKEAFEKLIKSDAFRDSDFDLEELEGQLKSCEDKHVISAIEQYRENRSKNADEVQNFCSLLKAEKTPKNPYAELSAEDQAKMDELLKRTRYGSEVTSGQRRYGPPPKDTYDGEDPSPNCQVFIGKIPKDALEHELVPIFEKAGIIWDLRLMMEPMTNRNRGFAFCCFTNNKDAQKCVTELDNYEIRPNKSLGVCLSQSNCRLFVGSIPKTKTKDEIFTEFDEITQGLKDVIIYLQTEDKNKNRGFCFLEFNDHKMASQARRKLSHPKSRAFKNSITVDWADPIDEPSDEIMAKVKVLYVKNLSAKSTEDNLKELFVKHGEVDRVKKIKDYAFIHFKEREDAMKALEALNGTSLDEEVMEITLAKPIDRKKRERQMERKITNSFNGLGLGPRVPMNYRNGRMMGGYPNMYGPMGDFPYMGGYPGRNQMQYYGRARGRGGQRFNGQRGMMMPPMRPGHHNNHHQGMRGPHHHQMNYRGQANKFNHYGNHQGMHQRGAQMRHQMNNPANKRKTQINGPNSLGNQVGNQAYPSNGGAGSFMGGTKKFKPEGQGVVGPAGDWGSEPLIQQPLQTNETWF